MKFKLTEPGIPEVHLDHFQWLLLLKRHLLASV